MFPSHNHWPVLKATIINNFSPHSHKECPVYITLSKQKKPVSGIRFHIKQLHSHQNSNFHYPIQWTSNRTEPRCQNLFFFLFCHHRPTWKWRIWIQPRGVSTENTKKSRTLLVKNKKKEKAKFKAEIVRSLRSVNGGFGFYKVWTAPTNNSMCVCRCFPVMALPLSSFFCSCRE